MSVEENKAIVRRFYDEVWNRGNLDVADEVFATEYVRHDLRPTPAPPGPEGQKLIARMFRAGFPDAEMVLDFVVAEADMVVARWTIAGTHTGEWLGIPPAKRAVKFTGVNIFRLADKRVVEIWNYRDDLGLMQQLGAIQNPQSGPSG